MTPQQRLLEIRMEYAKDELLNSNKTVELIVNSVGLPNVSYFIKNLEIILVSRQSSIEQKMNRVNINLFGWLIQQEYPRYESPANKIELSSNFTHHDAKNFTV